MKGHLLSVVVLLVVGFLSSIHSQNSPGDTAGLSVLSFNIRQFGVAKYAKQDVVDILIKIVKDYDLIFVIELVDPSVTVLPGFVAQLNKTVQDQNFEFDYVLSERVGRTNYKEQYAVIYRTNVVQIINTYQYDDTNDIFQRPPFSVYIQASKDESKDLPPFFIIVIHTQPTDTIREIDGLVTVFDSASAYFSTSAGMILGDLNADCSYLSNIRNSELLLFTDPTFTWWINKDADTTSGASDCAYDRIITSASLTPYVVNGSVAIIDFDRIYDLTSEFTATVSDHYPVSITLEGLAVATTESTSSLSPSSTDQATERGAANTLNSNGVLLCLVLMILFIQL